MTELVTCKSHIYGDGDHMHIQWISAHIGHLPSIASPCCGKEPVIKRKLNS